ncbi:scarecrow-like protein 14 [Olea europaea var. sylvestris]|uniref:scarecrow-like protein 14 n=1 Tax=Olea europaea var. sylvestris TaxID=158386 RepID=UPI000C1D0D4D|nr:scarecrow-like protein 14 [Olea europaea var. sylvestris]XP_022892873.1 scarecrow-like protein 14 [Olea europaea var. sylvestris]XP_022892874.1 scarecrow-like protein 14 [Olea europaea var. sylvestris]
MDPRFSEMHNTMNGFRFDDETVLPIFGQSHDQVTGYKDDVSLDLNIADIPFLSFSPSRENFTPSLSGSTEVESPDDQDSDPVLKYLNQILIEENMDDKPSMFHDPLALQAAEKSLYDVLGQKYPPSPLQQSDYFNHSSGSRGTFLGSSGEYTNSSTNGANFIDPQWVVDPGEFNSSVEQSQLLDTASKSMKTSSQWSFGSVNSFNDEINIQVSSFENTSVIPNIFSDSESILQFKRGMEEASKFLPPSNQLIMDLDKYTLPPKSDEMSQRVAVKVEKDEIGNLTNGSRGRKHHHPEDGDLENVERSSKQSAVYAEDLELSEMFDKFLLCEPMQCNVDAKLPSGEEKNLLRPVLSNGSNGGRTRARKQESNSEAVDLRTLLISCAQSIAADDRRTAYEQLKQIRQHASPTGDAYQRLAYVFAYGLEARFSGTGTQIYASLASKKITAVEKLKAYQVYLLACPFKKISILFANKMIGEAASEATTLHIVDFGILYGFQWPILIQLLSRRSGGPPKLRITGIEFPQPGFRPAERVEETGRRLAKYCERFGVPFEYQAIATQNWETIKIEDLKITHGEVLAVNCLFRFGRLLDETVEADCPRDVVLNLIRKMNPTIFLHAVTSGSYSAPFFITRFKEALFHYSALFDMLDATLPRDNPQRMNFEQDFYGREIINVIACEGAGRVERPETHKQWQVRTMRAGFKPLPLNREIMKKLRNKVMAGYHKDFLFDEDSNWMLQGWKGRIICGSSCWVPA